MQSTAVYAPITFEEIVMVMINKGHITLGHGNHGCREHKRENCWRAGE